MTTEKSTNSVSLVPDEESIYELAEEQGITGPLILDWFDRPVTILPQDSQSEKVAVGALKQPRFSVHRFLGCNRVSHWVDERWYTDELYVCLQERALVAEAAQRDEARARVTKDDLRLERPLLAYRMVEG